MPAQRPYTYEGVPKLRQLLPNTGGLPGVEYAIVSLANARRAQDQGWSRLAGDQKIFTIVGPKGEVDCELFGIGQPIRGTDPSGGRRLCYIDKEIYLATGLGAQVAAESPKVEAPKVEAPKPAPNVPTKKAS